MSALQVLLIEDSPSDAALLKAHLDTDDGEFIVEWVPTFTEGRDRAEAVDCALLDLTLPDGGGLETVEDLTGAAPEVPVIVLTGYGDHAGGIEAVRLGAQDYLLKDDLRAGELSRAIRYAVERKHAEAERLALADELAERNRELALSNHTIFDESLTGMVQLDADATVLDANDAMGRLVGMDADDLTGLSLLDLLGPRHGAAMAAAVSAVFIKGRPHRRDAVLVRADGTTRLATLQLARLTMDASGSPVVLLTADDITDGSSAMLRQAHDQKLDELSRLASGLAHEIRSPLQYVTTSVDFARSTVGELLSDHGVAVADERRVDLEEALAEVAEGIGRISEIVTGMTVAAEGPGGEPEVHDINDVLRFPLAVARGQAPAGTVFDVIAGEVPPTSFSMGLMQQVVLNLLVNAVHAIDDRTATHRRLAGRVEVSTEADEDWVRLHVTDNGVGMSAHVMARATEPFYTTKTEGRGTGQGLALVRDILRQHGGTVTMDSEEGLGTTVTIWLPR